MADADNMLFRLQSALRTLAQVHTRDDSEVGFAILSGASPWDAHSACTLAGYNEAWATVRQMIGEPHRPLKDAADE